MRSLLQRVTLVTGVVVGVLATPSASLAQKALVYCPVPVDATGCNAIVTALTGSAFPLGVDRGYDGTGGTLDLKTVDLFTYSVFVVPSLADGATSQPYARLRDVEVVEHLKAALIGRIAMWSGSPDQGATNRTQKDALIQNLAGWAGAAFGTAKGPGLVALLDASANASARYDWVRAITPIPVSSDATLLAYDSVRTLNQRGATILTSGAGPIKYANMATFGFAVPNGAPGVMFDAVGQTGTTQGGQVVLVTVEAGNTSGAVVRTDKDDYAPGTTVVITGSGWQAGETVKLTLHMDPLRDADTELTATADGSGNFTNTQFAPADYDIGVRFVLTAVGQASGRRAQTTFTDAAGLQDIFVAAPTSVTVSAGNSATYDVTVDFNGNGTIGCTGTLSVSNLPAGTAATWSPSPGASIASNGADVARTLTISTSVAAPATTLKIKVTVPTVAGGQGCNGGSDSTDVTLTITAAANVAPVLAPIGNKSVNENTPLSFTATATDANTPAQTLTFSLDAGAPAGATIDASTGAFSWTPTEAQGPGTFSATIRVTDNGTPAMSDFETISITVNEVNSAPVLAAIGPKAVNEGSALTFMASATDADLPANTLAFSLAAGTDPVPSGATINASTGAFSWTPTEAQGAGVYKFKVVVTDNGVPALADDEEITVTVAEVNAAPVVNAIPDKTVDELTPLTFTATATDTDVPANTLTFTLQGTVPTGASITSAGVFTWTPTEAQGPGSYTITVRATDNGTPNQFGETTVKITVNEVNVAPTLTGVPPSATIPELAAYGFDADATDPDVPPQTLSFSLESAPAGAAIDPATGVFSWTPTEAQGPGSYTFKVKVSDGVVTTEASTTLTVSEVNVAPILAPIGNKTVDELVALSFTATATDADLPPNALTFSLVGAPSGASITAAGAFSWTPTEAQGPGNYTVTVKVTDNGSPALSDEEQITVTVNEVNILPTLTDVPPSATIPELAAYAFDANATDPDLPAQTLTFSLENAPTGASINPTSGAFSWTPSEAQGPGIYTFKVKVSDGMGATEQSITLTVTEVNAAPVLTLIGNKTVDELSLLSFTAVATDEDLPPNTLTFSLVGAPAGAAINPTSGAFSWTPTEAQGPGSFTFTVKVADSGTPSLSDEETITVTVNEVNVAPVLGAVGNKTLDEETNLSFTATATDADLPPNTLTFSLAAGTDPVPAGASINPSTGAFSWTPTEAQGPGVYKFNVRVTDNGTPALFDQEEITVTVNEVNRAPVLAAIGNKTVDELVALTFTATATDPDLPPNTLTFSLVGAPPGASISSSGAFSWTPTEAQGPATYTFAIKVTDNGSPAMTDEETITITVNEVNVAPALAAIGNKTIDEKTALTFTATATDADLPPNTLTFSLTAGADAVPAGAAINPSTGEFSWTPTEAQGPGAYKFKVRVTDSGTPNLFDDEEITVTVNEVNEPPVLAAIGNKSVDEETALTFSASATDPDLPPNALAFSLVGAPAGATINASTGAFSWTPSEAQGPGSYTFTVRVTDDGGPALADEEQITVTVKEINKAPTVGAISAKTVNEGVALTFTAAATDPDLPANGLTFSLVSPPAGATINPSTGAFSWTPPDGPTVPAVMITVRVTDNGTPALSDDEVFAVTVNNVDPTATFNVPAGPFNEGQTFGISLTNPLDVPADVPTLKYAFDCGTGSGYSAASATSTATCPALDNPGQSVKGKIIDKDGGVTEYTGTVPVNNQPPVLGAITISPSDVVPINTTITASAPFTDVGTKDTHTGVFAWDDGTSTTNATISESNGSGSASATHKYTATGVYVVQLTLRDKDGAEVSTIYQYVVVYDPAAGFVTGGGWFNSPAGAYAANTALTGKANFGFVSKYKKGQSTPDGETEFQFHAASFNFKSTSYEWLVIAGAKAQYKGSGTINGSGDYFFLLTAIDGDLKSKGSPDTFRMKVWNKTTLAVIYDNQMGALDTADPPMTLGGGSIQIHDK